MYPLKTEHLGKVVIISPHDDDGNIGCGGLITMMEQKPHIIVVTNGMLGYMSEEEKGEIIHIRRREALESYKCLGLEEHHITYLNYPDMSLQNYKNWTALNGEPGAYQTIFKILREQQATTVFVPSEMDFHPDHKASFDAGWVASFQAREPMMPDLGKPAPIKQVLIYQVWQKLLNPTHQLQLSTEVQQKKRDSLLAYRSQTSFIEELETMGNLTYHQEVFLHHYSW